MKVLVTGSKGFIGKNLIIALKRLNNIELFEYDIDSPPHLLMQGLACSDVIFHLAGVNRPLDESEFIISNTDFTRKICMELKKQGKNPLLVFSSSIQAELKNPYGISKKKAEEVILNYEKESSNSVAIFRLPGVFGKWCKPDYNSVVATFCHHLARDEPISISSPSHEIELVYIDDVVSTFVDILRENLPIKDSFFYKIDPSYRVTLSSLATTLKEFRQSRSTLQVPDFSSSLKRKLFATYLSYLPPDNFAYNLSKHKDNRGELAELLKSDSFGQIFISRTMPGITRGNHYHDTKIEKFVVVEGEAVIRFRHVLSEEIIEYKVSSDDLCVVDIPPGYSHSIKNIGKHDLVVLFWANQIFQSDNPDTYHMDVK